MGEGGGIMSRGGRTRDRTAPERRCIATGESGPAAGLLRFVLGPDGTVVPDLAERLPGRGAWLTADRDLVDKAAHRRLFSRAFRAEARAPGDLAALVERLLAERLIGILSMARKAGAAVTGFEKVRERLRDGRAGVLVQASDGAADGVGKLARIAPAVSRIGLLDSGELGLAFGRDFAIHAALDRGGFADRATFESHRLAGFRPTESDGTGQEPAGQGVLPAAGLDQGNGSQGDPGQDIG